MPASPDPTDFPLFAVGATGLAVACSVGCAAVLYAADERGDAVWIVPFAWTWGAAALAVSWSLRRQATTRHFMVIAVLVALAVRLPLLGTPWLLSDDAWRYLWEGGVLASGLNPFTHAPSSLVGLDDELLARVNHPDIPSIYPPLALVWFRLIHAAGGTPIAAQVLAVGADLVTVVALSTLLADRQARAWPAMIFALHPLPALEGAGSAHLEAPALALVALGLLAVQRGRPALAWLGIGGGGLVKLLPLVALPALWRHGPRRAASLVPLLAVAILSSAPVAGAGWELVNGFGSYARHWSFNGLFFPALSSLIGDSARPLLVSCAVVVLLGGWRARPSPTETLALVGAVFVCTSPTVHPWYALWPLVPSLALGRWTWAVASLPLLGSYLVLATWDPATGSWSEPAWLWWVTWPPALLLGAAATRTPTAAPPTSP